MFRGRSWGACLYAYQLCPSIATRPPPPVTQPGSPCPHPNTLPLLLAVLAQVVGRVHLGKESLESLSDISTTPDDAPIQRIRIAK